MLPLLALLLAGPATDLMAGADPCGILGERCVDRQARRDAAEALDAARRVERQMLDQEIDRNLRRQFDTLAPPIPPAWPGASTLPR